MNKAFIIHSGDFIEKVKAIKDEEGKNIWLFGGASLISSFLNNKLIDLFVLSVHPVLLGGGKALFGDLKSKMDLMHIDTKTYPGGLVQLFYIPKPYFDLSTFLG